MMSGYLHNTGSLNSKSRRNMGMSWPADIHFWRPLHVTENIFIPLMYFVFMVLIRHNQGDQNTSFRLNSPHFLTLFYF